MINICDIYHFDTPSIRNIDLLVVREVEPQLSKSNDKWYMLIDDNNKEWILPKSFIDQFGTLVKGK